jgi:hypothetical protein
MTSLIGARRRAEEFDAALRSRTTSPASPELESLLSVVDALQTQPAPAPRADFSARLRERLMAEAAEVLTPSDVLALPPRRKGARERRLTIAASAFVLIGGSAGMAAAAQSSTPGDALYPIKRGLESGQRMLHRDEAGKGRTFLDQAGDRLSEARQLADRNASEAEISSSLRSFATQAMTGSDLLLGSYGDKADPAAVSQVRSFTANALTQLDALAKVAPAGMSEQIAQVGSLLQRIDAAASEACPDCSDLPALTLPEGMAQVQAIQKAMASVRMKKLDNSHPTVGADLPEVGDVTRTPATSGDSGSGTSGGGTAPSTPKLPDGKDLGVDLPKDPKDLLGAVDDATGGLLGKVGDTTDKVLPKDLQKTTDDLLP